MTLVCLCLAPRSRAQ